MNAKIVTLVKREFWEHKSLWLVPAVTAALFLLGGIFGGMHFSGGAGVDIRFGPAAGQMFDAQAGRDFGAMSLLGITGYLTVFSALAVFTYLLDCLFAERKDRSILFWKSLPVSDWETVASKLLVAMLVVPVMVLAVATLLQPVLAGIAWLRFPEVRPLVGGFVSGLTGLPYVIVGGLFGLLWYLPLAAYLMLASVLARRAPLMYAVIPPLALSIAERMLFDTRHVGRFVAERLFPWPGRVQHLLVDAEAGWKTLGGDWWLLFQDLKLWLGLVAAAGMMYMVVRLRRYRDET